VQDDGVGGDVARWRLGRLRPCVVVERTHDVGKGVDRLDEVGEHLRRGHRAHRVDHLRRRCDRIERGKHPRRLARQARGERHGPELVRADEVRDDVLHRPLFASAPRGPRVVVEAGQDVGQSPSLPQERRGRVARRPFQTKDRRTVVPRRDPHCDDRTATSLADRWGEWRCGRVE
jgi:hypothetical protein